MSSSRVNAALPAVLTFVFGLAFGLVAGRILWGDATRSAETARAGAAPAAMGGSAMGEGSGQPPARDEGPSPEKLRALLAQHEALLAKTPDDVGLLRTVGQYHAMLDEQEKALERYGRARELAEKAGDAGQAQQILIDEGIALSEAKDVKGAFAKLREAAARDPKDVRSRLTQVAIYLMRVMPAPPEGFDRKAAVADAETLLDEVQAIDPQNPTALEFRGYIDSVRQMMGRPRADAPAEAAPAAPPAP